MNNIAYIFSIVNNKLVFYNQIILSKKIGEGGEGIVYEVNKNELIKIYKNNPGYNQNMQFNKLSYMVTHRPQDTRYLAWPEKLVFNSNNPSANNFLGFIMKKFDNIKSISNIYDTDDREKIFPGITWLFLFNVARNVAYVVEYLHKSGYIIGDINENNILIDNKNFVYFIDCDSYKISNKNFNDRTVGLDEYTSKEMLDLGKLGSETIHQEQFSFAIMLFKILMLGAHPFNVVCYGNANEPPTRSQNIQSCRSVFSEKNSLPKYTPPLYVIPDKLIKLFQSAFVCGCSNPFLRPTSMEWFESIEIIIKHGDYIKCRKNSNHIYLKNSLNKCPWCEYYDKSGIDAFPTSVSNRQNVNNKQNSHGNNYSKHKVIFSLRGSIIGSWKIIINNNVVKTSQNKRIIFYLPNGVYNYTCMVNNSPVSYGSIYVNNKKVIEYIKHNKKTSKKIKNKYNDTHPLGYGIFNFSFSMIVVVLAFFNSLGLTPFIIAFLIILAANSNAIRGNFGRSFVIFIAFILDIYMIYTIISPLSSVSRIDISILLSNKFFLEYTLLIFYSIFESLQPFNGHDRIISLLTSIIPITFFGFLMFLSLSS